MSDYEEPAGIFTDCVQPGECSCRKAGYEEAGAPCCAIPRFHQYGVRLGIISERHYIDRFERSRSGGAVIIYVIGITIEHQFSCPVCTAEWCETFLDPSHADCPRCGLMQVQAKALVNEMKRWCLPESRAAYLII